MPDIAQFTNKMQCTENGKKELKEKELFSGRLKIICDQKTEGFFK